MDEINEKEVRDGLREELRYCTWQGSSRDYTVALAITSVFIINFIFPHLCTIVQKSAHRNGWSPPRKPHHHHPFRNNWV